MKNTIYKIMTDAQWAAFEQSGVFHGASIDLVDGYIHFSTETQMRETAAKHFAGKDGLVLVAAASDRMGDALKYEKSRGGDLFPHLYAPFDMNSVIWEKPLPLDAEGNHQFPEDSI